MISGALIGAASVAAGAPGPAGCEGAAGVGSVARAGYAAGAGAGFAGGAARPDPASAHSTIAAKKRMDRGHGTGESYRNSPGGKSPRGSREHRERCKFFNFAACFALRAQCARV